MNVPEYKIDFVENILNLWRNLLNETNIQYKIVYSSDYNGNFEWSNNTILIDVKELTQSVILIFFRISIHIIAAHLKNCFSKIELVI